jgi:hypothetical protein
MYRHLQKLSFAGAVPTMSVDIVHCRDDLKDLSRKKLKQICDQVFRSQIPVLLSEAQPKNAIINPTPQFGNHYQPRAGARSSAIDIFPYIFFKQFYKCQNFTILQCQNFTILQVSKFYNSTVSKFYNSTSVKILQFYRRQNFTILHA